MSDLAVGVDAARRRMLRARDQSDGAHNEPLDVAALARVALTSDAHLIRTVAGSGPAVQSVPAGRVHVATSNGATAKTPSACTLAAATCTVSYPQSLSGAKRVTVEYAGGPASLPDARTVDDPTG